MFQVAVDYHCCIEVLIEGGLFALGRKCSNEQFNTKLPPLQGKLPKETDTTPTDRPTQLAQLAQLAAISTTIDSAWHRLGSDTEVSKDSFFVQVVLANPKLGTLYRPHAIKVRTCLRILL